MNENGNEKCSCCFLLLVLVFPSWFHLSFVAFCCSSLLVLVFEIESVQSQKSKQAKKKCLRLLVLAFCCSFWFLHKYFHLNIALLVLAFCWYEKPKLATKNKKVQMETMLCFTTIYKLTILIPQRSAFGCWFWLFVARFGFS